MKLTKFIADSYTEVHNDSTGNSAIAIMQVVATVFLVVFISVQLILWYTEPLVLRATGILILLSLLPIPWYYFKLKDTTNGQ